MSAETARALALLYQAYAQLGELFDLPANGPHSAIERAWDACDDAIQALEGPATLPRVIVREPPLSRCDSTA